ncbi:urease accessory protein UreE [Lyngbya confervoides]|uniref:Urease accessory protein UreE n=1 Tax=Lyngbya confervoides BDU141951 TaxID=1574623 RepID=A0ABD4TAB5_9CYAN|nr:urease accessory protein UreE [Lyngbya confervoides]MCM1985402.1 urease accessory protein UreE [Lyngbya confervoides BDU141951]
MLTLVAKVAGTDSHAVDDTLSLTAAERQRSFYRCTSTKGQPLKLQLKRGTVLNDGDILLSAPHAQEARQRIQVLAQPEPVLTLRSDHPLALLKAAYHLGNRHVPLEVGENYLRLSPDPVLQTLLAALPVTVTAEVLPFYPERGAYLSHHD